MLFNQKLKAKAFGIPDWLQTCKHGQWALSTKNEKALDGVYTIMVRVALNVSWEEHITNVNLYGKLPQMSDKIRQRRVRLAGHCVRHPELSACEFILWEPKHGQRSKGRPKQPMLILSGGIQSSVSELKTLMEDRGSGVPQSNVLELVSVR